ncbi:MAG: hypothetical protein EPN22_13450 [Nitrospirae bacterium]|nr:MAG: hypothetical protein EPN22_13450 [Nitrospirota bacterium]
MNAEDYFLEIPNIILLLFYTICILSYTKQKKIVFFIFLGHILLIFLTNGLLFDPGYMSDQGEYLRSVQSLRDNFEFNYEGTPMDMPSEAIVTPLSALKTQLAAMIYYLVPLMCNSVFSVAGMNYVFYMMIFFFMYKKNLINQQGMYFFLFYPSLALYSAVGLRDTLILFFMFTSVYYLINNRYVPAMVLSSALFVLKVQNYLIFLISLLLWVVIDKGINPKKILLLILSVIFLVLLGDNISVDKVNFYRMAFAAENGLDPLDIDLITGNGDLLLKGFQGIGKFLLMPLPWEVRNALQFIQTLENIGILALLFYGMRAYRKLNVKDRVIRFLFAHVAIAFAVYGLVISNYGTAARYRYTYVTVFFIFFYHRLHQIRKQQLSQKGYDPSSVGIVI